ncbi:MAG: hypothetical protein DRG34_04575, partial [Deltaproteobacteria bacterium]
MVTHMPAIKLQPPSTMSLIIPIKILAPLRSLFKTLCFMKSEYRNRGPARRVGSPEDQFQILGDLILAPYSFSALKVLAIMQTTSPIL